MKNLYKVQKNFFDRIKKEAYSNKNYVDSIRDYCIGVNKNVVDVLNVLDLDPSKEPKSNSKLHQKIETLDGAVDIVKYALNMCLEYDVALEELLYHFEMKHRTVEQKFSQKQFLKSNRFKNSQYAFIFDIDGVLANHVEAYKQWFFVKTGIFFKTFDEIEKWKTANIDEYKEFKEEYRLSGFKTTIPAVEGANEILEFCHKKGIVSLLTNRPAKSYPILYAYTIEWLYNTKLMTYVDMIHFTDLGEKRYFFDRFNNKTVYFFEDNVYNIINTNERNNVFNVFIRNESNIDVPNPEDVLIAGDLNTAYDLIKVLLNEKNNDFKQDA